MNCFVRTRGETWFRLFGYGIAIVDHRIYPPLFSERNGFRKCLHVGHFGIQLLRPQRTAGQ